MSNLENRIHEKGQQILKQMEGPTKSIFDKDWWYGRIMEWSMKNEVFKTQMFRFVDVLPCLRSGSDVSRHLKEYFTEGGEELPPVFSFGLGMGSLAPGILAGAVRKNVTQMAKMFIAGESPKEALPVLRKARSQDIGFTVDLLGEACLSEKEALNYQNRYLELIDWLAVDSQKWTAHDVIDKDDLGNIPRVNVSVKLTSLYSQIKNEAWEETKSTLKERLRPILDKAIEKNVFINIDMEQYDHKDLTIEVFQELLLEPMYKDYRHWGVVIQAYLRDSYADTVRLTEFAKHRGTPLTIRLVKGAYWDYETIHAEQSRWPYPVYTNKAESDANYEKCAKHLLNNHEHIRLALGSHNVRSIAAALVCAEELGLPKSAMEIQMLYGMAEPIKCSLVKMGYRVREYAPVGELIPGMAYLVRRLLENTSNESWLRSKFAEHADSRTLLKDPQDGLRETKAELTDNGEFHNEAVWDFSIDEYRQRVDNALKKFQKELGQNWWPVINGKKQKSKQTMDRENPAKPGQIVARIGMANKDQAEQAVQAAKKALPAWRKKPAEERALLIEKVADLFNKHRARIIAAEIHEVGKTWKEADGDVCEAIDFCRYYARHMRQLAKPRRVGSVAGEISLYHYQPRGISVVIAPWNFPLAILTGMVSSSMVTGNTVIMKPAEQSSMVAGILMEILSEAGCPPGVVNYLPGYGEDIGDYLVKHKDTSVITFTGSREVGLNILRQAAVTEGGQYHVKKCITEMGGKNAIIIDSDADLDEAVAGTIYSAFAFAGQKCSACSRVIVLDEIYDRFLERLVETAKSIRVGTPSEPGSFLGPVVDQEAKAKILKYIEIGRKQNHLAYEGNAPDEGAFVAPTIFVDVESHSTIAQEEIFGPVLAVIKCKNLDKAIDIANDTPFALTGGIYSRSPVNIERVKRDLEVGNLYVNRGITGALVNRHPFGGFKLSGAGSKTGGPDYLTQYMEPRVVTENTLRRGFAPVEDE